MSDYISREDAFNAVLKLIPKVDDDGYCWIIRGDAAMAIDSIPAADVRPVVTCGKCKYGKCTGVSWFCDKHSGHADKFGEDASYHEYHSKYWFCADGEEKNHA